MSSTPSRSSSRIRISGPFSREAMIWPNSSKVMAISEPVSFGLMTHSTLNCGSSLKRPFSPATVTSLPQGSVAPDLSEAAGGQPLRIVEVRFLPADELLQGSLPGGVGRIRDLRAPLCLTSTRATRPAEPCSRLVALTAMVFVPGTSCLVMS